VVNQFRLGVTIQETTPIAVIRDTCSGRSRFLLMIGTPHSGDGVIHGTRISNIGCIPSVPPGAVYQAYRALQPRASQRNLCPGHWEWWEVGKPTWGRRLKLLGHIQIAKRWCRYLRLHQEPGGKQWMQVYARHLGTGTTWIPARHVHSGTSRLGCQCGRVWPRLKCFDQVNLRASGQPRHLLGSRQTHLGKMALAKTPGILKNRGGPLHHEDRESREFP